MGKKIKIVYFTLLTTVIAAFFIHFWLVPEIPAFQEAEKKIRSSFRQKVSKKYSQASKNAKATYGLFVMKSPTESHPVVRQMMPPKVVVLIHGLDEPGELWKDLVPALLESNYTVCEFRYPNDQPIRDSARFLYEQLNHLRFLHAHKVVLIGHSMGGLVAREMISSSEIDYAYWQSELVVPPAKGLIMLGTPNHGSIWARFRIFAELRDQWSRFISGEGHLLNAILDGAGEAGIDLIPDSYFLTELNARKHPDWLHTTIVAGSASPFTREEITALMGEWREKLPENTHSLLDSLSAQLIALSTGLGDGVVSAASTQMPGIEDYVAVPGNHLTMICNTGEQSGRTPPAIPVILERLAAIW